jgi:uncharacterized membrane protein
MEEKIALTREDYKKLKEEQAASDQPVQAKSKSRRIPIGMRFVILIVLIIISAIAGALVGYSGIGHGKAIDIFKGSAFSHVYDLVEKK